MSTKRIRTNQSRDNLYKLIYHNNKYFVYKVGEWNSLKEIGTSVALDGALSIIKSYSGAEIKSIEDW